VSQHGGIGTTSDGSNSVELLIGVHFNRERLAGLVDEECHLSPLIVETPDGRTKPHRPGSACCNGERNVLTTLSDRTATD
jgi:hypothetical protein